MRYQTSIIWLILSVLILCTVFVGCTPSDTPSDTDTSAMTDGSTVPETEETEAVTEPQTDTAPLETEAATTEEIVEDVISRFPYTLRITRTDVNIFDDAGYDFGYVNVLRPGVYTIVAEKADFEGNLWGKLKSGLGWIDITLASSKNADPLPIALGVADYELYKNGNYDEFIANDSAQATKLVFYANETLTHVRFVSLDFVENTFSVPEQLYMQQTLTPGRPLLIAVPFHGDLTTYRIIFNDESGTERSFDVYISGRNGALMMIEYS